MTAPQKFAHIVYKTGRMPEMIDWYVKVLKCQVQHASNEFAFLSYDEEHHRIAFVALPASEAVPTEEIVPTINRPGFGVHHVAYTWPTVQDLLEKYKMLKAAGILPLVQIRHGLTLSMYYGDPDGNSLEFQVDVLDVDEANEFMRGEAFAINPVGEPFDADELVAALDAGQPLAPLILRSDQPEPAALISGIE